MSSARRLLPLTWLLTLLVLSACANTPNYLMPIGPRYAGVYAPSTPADDGAFKALSWNIQYSRRIDDAIHFLQQTPELQHADVLLLQEMDGEDVEAIARALGMNYVYYPASIHVRHDNDFGEAILSTWPLTDDAKLTLPHYSPRNGQTRIAVRAWVQTPGLAVLVVNTHTETSLMTPAQRQDQVQAILADVEDVAFPVIVGGDFNTLTPWERRALLKAMRDAGFAWATADAGSTIRETGAGVTMDYLFARGLEPVRSGVVSDGDVSDHLPLWAELR